jgi:hypothetical protein
MMVFFSPSSCELFFILQSPNPIIWCPFWTSPKGVPNCWMGVGKSSLSLGLSSPIWLLQPAAPSTHLAFTILSS